jgi:hypothetical protein
VVNVQPLHALPSNLKIGWLKFPATVLIMELLTVKSLAPSNDVAGGFGEESRSGESTAFLFFGFVFRDTFFLRSLGMAAKQRGG